MPVRACCWEHRKRVHTGAPGVSKAVPIRATVPPKQLFWLYRGKRRRQLWMDHRRSAGSGSFPRVWRRHNTGQRVLDQLDWPRRPRLPETSSGMYARRFRGGKDSLASQSAGLSCSPRRACWRARFRKSSEIDSIAHPGFAAVIDDKRGKVLRDCPERTVIASTGSRYICSVSQAVQR